MCLVVDHVECKQTSQTSLRIVWCCGHGRETAPRRVKMRNIVILSSQLHLLVCIFLLLFIPTPAMATERWSESRSRSDFTDYRLPRVRDCFNTCHQRPISYVCGNDKKTYRNKYCIEFQRRCRGRSHLQVAYLGRCQTNKRRHRRRNICIRRRAEMLRQYQKFHNNNSLSYIPVCRDDGTFKKIQCLNVKNICFCVDRRTGAKKPNTTRRHPKKPRCGGGARKKKGKVDKCSKNLRKQFNENLIHQFEIEFKRVVNQRQQQRVSTQVKRNTVYPVGMLITGEQGYTLNSTELRVVEWKFSELDMDHDNALSFRELRSLRRVVRRVLKPQACARRFAKRCDINKNRKIERSEWSLCMGINTAAFIKDYVHQNVKPTEHHIPPASIIGLMNRRRSDKSFYRSQDCLKANKEATQKNFEDPRVRVFVPQCSPDGSYKRKQCHHINGGEKLCFCMNKDGEVVRGAIDSKDCRKIKPIRQFNHFKGCPPNRKKRFLTELLDQMVEDTKTYWARAKGPHMPTGTLLVERAIRWKFYLMDINKNGKLDKKEMRKFKEEVKRNIQQSKRQVARDLRKCARNFVRYCDGDGDKSITLPELISCTSIKKKRNPLRVPPINFLTLKTS